MASLRSDSSSDDSSRSVLLWSVEEAVERGVSQIGASACGATALLNAFSMLRVVSMPTPAEANAAVNTHLRRPGAGLQEYLASRSGAGATHEDLIAGCQRLPRTNVGAKFVPYRDIIQGEIPFLEWCHKEMSDGAALILCMNLQLEGDATGPDWIPDAWHHQTAFGADLGRRALLLTNPVCAMSDTHLHTVLSSGRELLVRDKDVFEQAQLGAPPSAPDISALSPRWRELDVGRRALDMARQYDPQSSTHRYLRIPAQYEAGVTVLRVRSALMQLLRAAAESGAAALHFTVHRNWSWVVQDALRLGCWETSLRSHLHSCSREMPSRQGAGRVKPQYALFRVEVVGASGGITHAAWATSQALEFLDPKDALFRCLSRCGSASLMPPTVLVPWDCRSVADISIPPSLVPSPARPCMLKASLGSGGYGLYFVDSVEDIVTVAKNHAAKATSVPDFVENLVRDYGAVPSWSIQRLVPSMLLEDGRKCQFRTYVVISGQSMYLYENIEARIVCWDASVASGEELRTDEAAFCAGSAARPYNHGRMKVRTERVLIDEIDFLKKGHGVLAACTADAFRAMRPDIERRMETPSDGGPARMAIAGVDLLLTADYTAFIVEINNNPAMPGESKNMSALYKRHLRDLASDIMKLGLSGDPETTAFSKIW